MTLTLMLLTIVVLLFLNFATAWAMLFGVTWPYMQLHPFIVLAYLGGYLLFGFLWSLFKWSSYMRRQAKFATRSWSSVDLLSSKRTATSYLPLWIWLWPFNIIYTCLDDYLARIAEFIYKSFEKLYDVIALEQWRKHGPRNTQRTDD